MTQPAPRSKDDPNHSGANDGLHVWEREVPPEIQNMTEEEAEEILRAFANDEPKGKNKKDNTEVKE